MSFWKWSKTPANNGTADPSCPFPEGMAPSAVNDGTRGMMAALAKYRDDVTGALITGGTSTAYTVTSNQGFPSKVSMDGAEIAITIHSTNGDTPTLNVDGLGADPIIIDTVSSVTPVPTGTLLTGGVYTLVYYNAGNTWRLKDFYQLPFVVPIGSGIEYWGDTVPSDNFAFPYGQALSRTTFAACFARFGTKYGSGDGSTTFNLPDKRGRVSASKDDMGGTAANRLTTTTITGGGATLGNSGGAQVQTIAQNNLPNVAPTFFGNNGAVNVNSNRGDIAFGNDPISASGGGIPKSSSFGQISSSGSFTPTGSISSINGGVTQQAMGIVQPTIVCNYIIRVK